MPLSAMRIIFIFSLSAFTLGLSEFIVIGLLSQISQSFGLSLDYAGLLVASYAIGISIGSPIVTWVTRKYSARMLCTGLMGLFTLLNIAIALSSSLAAVLIVRVIAGVVHGTFFSVASAIIPSLSAPGKTSMAIALMFSGLTLAMVMGVPGGIWIAQVIGWHGVFLFIAGLSCACAGFMMHLFPKHLCEVQFDNAPVSISFRTLSFYLITILGFGGGFIFYTYVEPWLSIISNMDLKQIGLALALVGIGSLAGNLLGGLLPVRLGLNAAAIIVLFLQILSLIGLAIYSAKISPLPFLVLWATAAFALAPMMQTAAVSDKDVINNPRLSASFNATAFNLGISLAGYSGGILISHGDLKSLPLIAASVVLVAIPIALVRLLGSRRSDRIHFISKADQTL